ncbi:hypothetical protein [Bacillus thuringiensis]|uniref:hypothetical protein n=2 Tax=Bacillus cereus group TaxID=86661 RepID=UPI001C3ED501|nr:hypothetical protein [Bacillus thuringiensis]
MTSPSCQFIMNVTKQTKNITKEVDRIMNGTIKETFRGSLKIAVITAVLFAMGHVLSRMIVATM